MSLGGTQSHVLAPELPPLVARAVETAAAHGFEFSCRAPHGRLISLLAAGVGAGMIGETGTGCGVGLAWLASSAESGARLVSVERELVRAETARDLFGDDPRVTVLTGDWKALQEHAPFDLLVLDGGGQGKGSEQPIDPTEWLNPGGVVVVDDFTPSGYWPPTYAGIPDRPRIYWLTHPDLLATEIRTEPGLAAVIAVRKPG